MATNQPSNFNSVIHATDYAKAYRQKQVGKESLITDCYHGSAERRELLDGIWKFSIDPYNSFLRARLFTETGTDPFGKGRPSDYDLSAWEDVTVPSCWNMLGDRYFHYEGSAVYTRTFRYQAVQKDERVFLKVGAANYECFVFLNQKHLTTHRGGSTPFFVELTAELKSENQLSIVVSNRREGDQVPMDNTDWFNYGGLYRSVELMRLPHAFIRRFSVALVPGTNYSQIAVAVHVDDGSTDRRHDDIPQEVILRIEELGIEHRVPLVGGVGNAVVEASPQLWSPKSPKLYEVELSYGTLDLVRDRIGFREITVEGLELRLNGKPLYLKGVSCHEESLLNGKSVTVQEIESMFDTAVDLGCNFVRLAHYPHSETVSRVADERGILLWEEIPVYWAIDFGNENTYADAENQLSELILRDINRASVILWSVGNENPDTDERLSFMSRLAESARALDPSRLITAACLWDRNTNTIEDRLAEHLDVIGLNEYFGWYEGDFEVLVDLFHKSKPAKPVIVSEFGAGALAGQHGTAGDPFTEEMQRRIYQEQISVIRDSPYVVGTTPWILFDFRSPRRNNRFQRGFNIKGLATADRRRRKLAFFVLRDYYRSR